MPNERSNEGAALIDALSDDGIGLESLNPDFKHVIEELRHSITWLRWAAGAVLAVGSVATGFAAFQLPSLTDTAAARIAATDNSTTMMVFELLRGAAFAAAVTSILFGIWTLGRACLDQATRFQKRLIAAHFLNYVLHTYSEEIKAGSMSLGDVVDFLKSWSDNVESAFTHVKFGSRRQSTSVVIGPANAQTSTGKANGSAPSE